MDGIIIRSRCQWYEKGERSNSFFLGLEKRNYLSRLVSCLKVEGKAVYKQEEIMNCLVQHYREVFCRRDNIPFNKDTYLHCSDKNVLSEQEKNYLERPIELEELEQTLRSLKGNKSPISSGFQPEFYKMMWPDIKHCFINMCTESFDKQKLPQTLREGVLILIPKVGKRKDDIKGYRPITLLNTGYKIISATIARRLKGVLTSIIGPEQTGFVPGRFIGSAIRLTYDVIHSVKEKGFEGLLVSLDMDNAFNAVEWSWIQASLASRGFPQCIIQWFLTLYNESFSRLTYNGHISEPIPLSRSARQGDPISGYLFIIALEHLLDRIRANENIKGIKIGTTEVKLSAYADDVLCLLDGNPNSLRQLFAELGIFAKFSGLKPNIEKKHRR